MDYYLITESSPALQSVQLLVSLVFCPACLASIRAQSKEDIAELRVAGGQQATRPIFISQILCRFLKYLIIVCAWRLAFIHVCGPVPHALMSSYVHNRQLPVYLFCITRLSECLTPQPLASAWGHSISWIQKKSNMGSRLVRI